MKIIMVIQLICMFHIICLNIERIDCQKIILYDLFYVNYCHYCYYYYYLKYRLDIDRIYMIINFIIIFYLKFNSI